MFDRSNALLADQITFLKQELAREREARAAVEARLAKEIAANRRREDALTAKILETAGLRARIPERADAAEPEPVEIEAAGSVSDLDVEQIAREIASNGLNYTAEQWEQLKAEIRRTPESYGLEI